MKVSGIHLRVDAIVTEVQTKQIKLSSLAVRF